MLLFNNPASKTYKSSETKINTESDLSSTILLETEKTSIKETVFNKIANYFITNYRLTSVLFLALVILGGLAAFNLKTSGFPSPTIDSIQIQTTYLGASSTTVNEKVTIPLENKIGEVSLVDKISSSSNNNLSVISLSLKDGADISKARSEIENKVKSVVLPASVDTPVVSNPDFGGISFIFSIKSNSLEQTYSLYQGLKKEVQKLAETSKITEIAPLLKRIEFVVNEDTLKTTTITKDRIYKEIASNNQSLPIGNDLKLDDRNVNLVTNLDLKTLDQLKILEINDGPKKYKLQDLGEFKTVYTYNNRLLPSVISDNKDYLGHSFTIQTQKNSDQKAYLKKIETAISKLQSEQNFSYSGDGKIEDNDKTQLTLNYNIAKENQDQVNEILGSLFGSELKVDNKLFAKLGLLFGGMQLLFIVLSLLVSWRTALIACFSVPLSLVFTLVYLYITGETLNTLVLFSFVLVVGLVTDPVLVMLESMQRKIDKGETGHEVIKEAVSDVGNGLFLAFITNTIIFAPFLIVSGIFGQIIKYIPITIVPAAIGSLIVPLIFIPIIGSKFLKPSKKAVKSEVDNLWWVAKKLMNFNRWLLNKPRIAALIVILMLTVSIGIGIVSFATGTVKSVTFATNESLVERVSFAGSFKQGLTNAKKQEVLAKAINTIKQNNNVKTAYPFNLTDRGSGDFLYFIEFEKGDRKIQKTLTDFNDSLKTNVGSDLDTYSVKASQNGPSSSDYQINIAIKEEDPQKLKFATLEFSKILDKVCKNDDIKKPFIIKENCPSDQQIITKYNNGFTNSQKTLEILVDKSKLQSSNLILPGSNNTPEISYLNAQIKDLFYSNGDKKISTIKLGVEDLEIFASSPIAPLTIDSLKNTELKTLAGSKIKLSEVATIQELDSPLSIKRSQKEALNSIDIAVKKEYQDQANSAKIKQVLLDYFVFKPTEPTLFQKIFNIPLTEETKNSDKIREEDSKKNLLVLGIRADQFTENNNSAISGINKSISELVIALLLAVGLSYVILALSFKSFLQPINILFSLALSFAGVFPVLAFFAGGQFGFLEIVGLVILIGILENVAIFLLDDAYSRMDQGLSDKEAIILASGFRFRPVLLTSLTNLVSSIPVILFSTDYRALTLVIVSGLLIAGSASLITTPILFIALRRVGSKFKNLFKIKTKVSAKQ
jgi:hydrophobic/amphiphilic exporter-1 (mainly G- bacteria), HAE1 family